MKSLQQRPRGGGRRRLPAGHPELAGLCSLGREGRLRSPRAPGNLVRLGQSLGQSTASTMSG